MSTPVIFRKWPKSQDGDVIALFPTDLGTNDPYTCSSYQHLGQHGAADPVGVIQVTKLATPAEYADLKTELESIGYDDLKVVKRYQHDSFLKERRKQLSAVVEGAVEVLGNEVARLSERKTTKTKSRHPKRPPTLKSPWGKLNHEPLGRYT